jgi:hypothetical protein
MNDASTLKVDPEPTDSKGLSGSVTLINAKGNTTIDISKQPWTMAWPLVGEAKEIYTATGTGSVLWSPLSLLPVAAAQVWFRFWLDLPAPIADQPAQTAYALDLSSLTKGVARCSWC